MFPCVHGCDGCGAIHGGGGRQEQGNPSRSSGLYKAFSLGLRCFCSWVLKRFLVGFVCLRFQCCVAMCRFIYRLFSEFCWTRFTFSLVSCVGSDKNLSPRFLSMPPVPLVLCCTSKQTAPCGFPAGQSLLLSRWVLMLLRSDADALDFKRNSCWLIHLTLRSAWSPQT